MSGNSIRVSIEVIDQFRKPLEDFSKLLGKVVKAIDEVDFSNLYQEQAKTTRSFANFADAVAKFVPTKNAFNTGLKSLTGSTNKLKSSFGNALKTLGPWSIVIAELLPLVMNLLKQLGLWEPLMNAISSSIQGVIGFIKGLVDSLAGLIQGPLDWLADRGNDVVDFFDGLGKAFGETKPPAQGLWDTLRGMAETKAALISKTRELTEEEYKAAKGLLELKKAELEAILTTKMDSVSRAVLVTGLKAVNKALEDLKGSMKSIEPVQKAATEESKKTAEEVKKVKEEVEKLVIVYPHFENAVKRSEETWKNLGKAGAFH